MRSLNFKILNSTLNAQCARHFSGRARIRPRGTSNLTSTQQQQLEEKIRELQMMQMRNQQPAAKPGFLQVIKEGVLHGIGWSFAQRMVDSIFGPRTVQFFNPSSHDNFADNSSNNMTNTNDTSPFQDDGDQGWSWGADDFFEDE
ncbi:conserved hypothetical protein [Theileria equi strain WA]|uniref:Uncharacterized protein n=1 Tax=Theileria equi strain WA TaxID=1537102 RepID=L1LD68_THEEQ|nr:conserved hypothetical protein [Theileria equi strain WA]EKX73271.1 conserved hypothetical protein [Theileria equi strain WA]|eukprot:XP_004832723.1 conserved hypothetical protein [Theileria equi strain WA]